MNFFDKIITLEKLSEWRTAMRHQNKRVVVTNGCFDLIHVGHVTYLQTARNLGDVLLVGLNSDTAVKILKGNDRPINNEVDRASILASVESVGAVCIFNSTTATEFLNVACPDIYAKGGDYTIHTLNPDERRTVKNCGGRIVIIPLVEGRSTTHTLKKITS